MSLDEVVARWFSTYGSLHARLLVLEMYVELLNADTVVAGTRIETDYLARVERTEVLSSRFAEGLGSRPVSFVGPALLVATRAAG